MDESIFGKDHRFTVSIRERQNGSYGWEMKVRAYTLKELEECLVDGRALVKRKLKEWERGTDETHSGK